MSDREPTVEEYILAEIYSLHEENLNKQDEIRYNLDRIERLEEELTREKLRNKL